LQRCYNSNQKTPIIIRVDRRGGFDESSKYILQKVDVSKCLQYDAELYNEIFDMLVDAGLESCYTKTSRITSFLESIFRCKQ